MNIKDFNKAKVLAALYNNAKLQGRGFLHYTPDKMTEEQAQKILSELGDKPYFDYFNGRVMKICIEDELDTRLYDRDNGQGAAEMALLEAI